LSPGHGTAELATGFRECDGIVRIEDDLQPTQVLPCHDPMEILIWSLVILLMLVGLIGCVVPLLPGTTLILAAALLQKWLLPETLTWLAVGWIAAFWLMSVLADLGCTLLGTKLFGGGRWGMAGATGGALAGMFFSLPALLLGTMFGAIAAEKWLGKKTDGQALRAGAGAVLGFLVSGFAKLACALVMIGLYAVSVLSVTG
jgi:uncharacterized protein